MKLCYSLLGVFLITTLASARFDLKFLKNIDITNKSYEELNPLHGVTWDQGIIENYGEFLPKEDPRRQLIQLLFHRAGTFDPSSSPTNKIVQQLTPENIGYLVGHLWNGTLKPKTKLARTLKEGQFNHSFINKIAPFGTKRDDGSQHYSPFVFRVLLTLLWGKAESKDDYKSYYKALHSIASKTVQLPSEDFSKQQFSQEDLERDLPNPKEYYDLYIYKQLTKSHGDMPLLHQATSTLEKGESFADCGATSLRNFFMLLTLEEGRFNTKYLDPLGINDKINSFFQTFSTPALQASQEARNAWGCICSSLEGVDYLQGHYEIKAGADNMLAVINQLYPELKAITWEKVFTDIRPVLQRVTLEQNKLGTITFQQNSRSYVWNFQAGHFYISALPDRLTLYKYEQDWTGDQHTLLRDLQILHPATDRTEVYFRVLRQNEVIGSILRSSGLSLDTKIALLNRLTTADARGRVFSIVATDKLSIDAIVKTKNTSFLNNDIHSLVRRGKYELAQYLEQQTRKFNNSQAFIGHQSSVNSLSFSPDGNYLASGSSDKTLKLWDIESGKLLKTFTGHEHYVTSLSFSPDGNYLASSSGDKTLKLWDIESGKLLKTFTGHQDWVRVLSFSPDGKYLASGSDDRTLKLWDIKSRKLLKTFTGYEGGVSFSPDGNYLASSSGDKTLKLWDIESGKLLKTFTGHQDWVTSLSFSPDGNYLASSSGDKTLKLWDIENGKLLNTFTGHKVWVFSVSFSPDGNYLASGSNDKTLKLWDVRFLYK